jgi:(p)ppGpp synthase/HD superfamily hydrolase
VNDLHLITSAAYFAAEAHKHQTRKEWNEAYIIHPMRVATMAANLGESAEFIAACYMHDVVEDTGIPQKTINNLFPKRTAELVDVMTKWWQSNNDPQAIEEWKVQYNQRLAAYPGGAVLKFLDRIDNVRDFTKLAHMSPKTHSWAKNYVKKTRKDFFETAVLWNALDPKYDSLKAELEAATRTLELAL